MAVVCVLGGGGENDTDVPYLPWGCRPRSESAKGGNTLGQAGRSIKCPFHPTAELKVFSSPSPRQAELPPPPPDRCAAPHAAHSCRLYPFLARQKPIFSPANEGTNASDKVPSSYPKFCRVTSRVRTLISPGANVFQQYVTLVILAISVPWWSRYLFHKFRRRMLYLFHQLSRLILRMFHQFGRRMLYVFHQFSGCVLHLFHQFIVRRMLYLFHQFSRRLTSRQTLGHLTAQQLSVTATLIHSPGCYPRTYRVGEVLGGAP